MADYDEVLDRVRELCLALPETSERLSHGHPTFFVRDKRSFAMVLNDHHGDGPFALWAAAEGGVQQMLVEADPERFFRPPYLGHRGWLGLRLDRELHWDELAGILEEPTSRSRLRSSCRRPGRAASRRGRVAGRPRPERRRA